VARIRTVKPEIPHDKDLAKVSRDARLTFIYLWTVSDDAGYFRAALRYLIGVLYPHDPDVTEESLATWLGELAGIGCIVWKHLKDGSPVGYIPNFTKHQRIDHPSRSFFSDNLGRPSRKARETLAKGVSESLSPLVSESLSHESPKALVELRSTREDMIAAGAEAQQQRQGATREAVVLVFDYWRLVMGHPAAILDDKREKRIRARLREAGGNVSDLLFAIDGARKDDYLMGRDEKAPRKYDGVETVLRDRAQVERLMQLAGGTGPHPVLAAHDSEAA
jgi:hypothetical protein